MLAFCSVARSDAPTSDRSYKITPGDRITVTVLGQADLSGEILVDGEGNIVLPLVGTLDVKDLTVLECQQVIRARLAEGVRASL